MCCSSVVGEIVDTRPMIVPLHPGYSFAGSEAIRRCVNLDLEITYPIQRGLITDWNKMERLWQHAFHNELRAVPEEHPILLADTPLNPSAVREKTTEIMFEIFNAPALYLANQAMLVLYSSGRSTGVVLDSGDGITYSASLYEGHILPHSVQRLELAGRDLTNRFREFLISKGYMAQKDLVFDTAEDLKHNWGFITLGLDRESTEIKYKLPDGQLLALGNERSAIPEALFQPHLIGVEGKGMHELVFDSVRRVDPDLRRDLYGNIILAGGSTMFPATAARIVNGIANLAPSSMKVKVVAPPERKHSCWIGGSILASMDTFRNIRCSKQEYHEAGSQIIHRKFF
ncbi:actin family [Crepidotus variabilis]|uniref:Actin family n=1 Tax=Crepidotus variabilis TaxID=179855 RepID=A0A9P6JSC3_9AGAR|nr:actin family [Crepidotus variabilis]